MTNSLPLMYSYKGQSWESYLKDMKVTTSQILVDSKDTEENGNVNLLPRKDINTYGTCPKMEVFKLVKCNSCNKVLLPSVFKSHREKFHSGTKIKVSAVNSIHTSTSSSSTVVKKKENQIREKKKKSAPTIPTSPLFPKPPSTPSPAIVANSVETVQLASPKIETVAADQINSQTVVSQQKVADKSNQVNNVTKCSYKNNSVVKPPVSLPTSITSTFTTSASVSSPVPSSSPSNSSPSLSPSSVSSLSSNSSFSINTGSKVSPANLLISVSLVTSVGKHKKLFQKTPKDSDLDKKYAATEGIKSSYAKSPDCTYQQSPAKHVVENNSDSKDAMVPNKTTLATSTTVTSTTNSSTSCASIFQIGTSFLVETTPSAHTVPLTTQTVRLKIPSHMSGIQMYSCLPKPLSMATPVTRRVGGSFVLRNQRQRLEKQRNEIQMAINSTCNMITSQSYKTISLLNMHHKPNILKSNSRGNKNQGIKRTANDKSVSLEHKQIRLKSDVNGFILHSDVHESAETNNCLKEKIAIFNMK